MYSLYIVKANFSKCKKVVLLPVCCIQSSRTIIKSGLHLDPTYL